MHQNPTKHVTNDHFPFVDEACVSRPYKEQHLMLFLGQVFQNKLHSLANVCLHLSGYLFCFVPVVSTSPVTNYPCDTAYLHAYSMVHLVINILLVIPDKQQEKESKW